MITKEELQIIANSHKLPLSSVEKDYVIGWVLCGLYQMPAVQSDWVFKGGTSLRKCYFEDYRFSEDLDFTLKNPILIDHLYELIGSVALWLHDNVGIEIDKERIWFESLNTTSKQQIFQGAIYYKGPVSPTRQRSWPRIKFDITSDEVLVCRPDKRKIIHSYSDKSLLQGPWLRNVRCDASLKKEIPFVKAM